MRSGRTPVFFRSFRNKRIAALALQSGVGNAMRCFNLRLANDEIASLDRWRLTQLQGFWPVPLRYVQLKPNGGLLLGRQRCIGGLPVIRPAHVPVQQTAFRSARSSASALLARSP